MSKQNGQQGREVVAHQTDKIVRAAITGDGQVCDEQCLKREMREGMMCPGEEWADEYVRCGSEDQGEIQRKEDGRETGGGESGEILKEREKRFRQERREISEEFEILERTSRGFNDFRWAKEWRGKKRAERHGSPGEGWSRVKRNGDEKKWGGLPSSKWVTGGGAVVLWVCGSWMGRWYLGR